MVIAFATAERLCHDSRSLLHNARCIGPYDYRHYIRMLHKKYKKPSGENTLFFILIILYPREKYNKNNNNIIFQCYIHRAAFCGSSLSTINDVRDGGSKITTAYLDVRDD